MKKIDSSTGPWAALAGCVLVGGTAAWGGVSYFMHGDTRPLTPKETVVRDYGHCLEKTDYDPTPDKAKDEHGKTTRIDIGRVMVHGAAVMIVAKDAGTEEPDLNFTFGVTDEVRHVTPDAATRIKLTALGC